MKRLGMITALLLIMALFCIIAAQAADYNQKSLGTKSSNDKKWRPSWQVGQKIYGYRIKIKSGKPIVNTVQFNDSDQHKEFTYARYFNSGEVIERKLSNPMRVGKIKINMDKAGGCSAELIVYTEKNQKEKNQKEKKHSNADYDRRKNQDKLDGILDGSPDPHDRGNGRGHNRGGTIGQAGGYHGNEGYVNLGVIVPGLKTQTVMWFIGGTIQAFEIDMVQGGATVQAVRLISGNRVIDEMEYGSRMQSGQAIRETIRQAKVTRIELDVTNNSSAAFRLGVQQ